MQILYDGYIYKVQKAGGISRYFNNIIKRLPESFTPMLSTVNSQNNIELPHHNNLKLLNYNYFRPYRISTILEKQFFNLNYQLKEYDIIHPTYYTLLSDRSVSSIKKPKIITIHDMIYELFENKIDNSKTHIAWKKDAVYAADAIICVSNNTKKDLLNFYPSVESKISVIYEGSELEAGDSYGDEAVPEYTYFIYVGGRTFYKNFIFLIKAFSELVKRNRYIRLCVVGPPFTKEELKLFVDLKLMDFILYYGYVTSNHLAKLYRCSVGLVYPSLYEGFGLPPLEAMACGAPVITSNCSSMPEITGDSAILIDPNSLDELIDAMLSISQEKVEREIIIKKGLQRADLFNWSHNVDKVVKLYNSFLST